MSQILLLIIIFIFVLFLIYVYKKKCDEDYYLDLIQTAQMQQQQMFLNNFGQFQNFSYPQNSQNYFYNNCNYERKTSFYNNNNSYNPNYNTYNTNNNNVINNSSQISNGNYIYRTPIKNTTSYYNNNDNMNGNNSFTGTPRINFNNKKYTQKRNNESFFSKTQSSNKSAKMINFDISNKKVIKLEDFLSDVKFEELL